MNDNTMQSMRETKDKKRGKAVNMNLTLVGCGFLGIYYAGVVACFRKYAPHFLRNKISGASAGAIVGCWILCDVSIDCVVRYFLQISKKARRKVLGPFNPNFHVKKYIYEALDKFLPEDAHLRVNGKLHISLTTASNGKNVIISHFDSREDLIEAILASSFVPLISGLKPPKYKGTRYIDGAFSNNLPILDEKTITVCPFSGKCDICPSDDNLLVFPITISAIKISNHNISRIYRIFFSPNFEQLLKLSERGYEDTLKFLLKNNLISCARCLAVQHTFAVPEAVDENYECDLECEECVKLREEALASRLPEDIVTVFQEAIDSKF